MFQVQIWWNKIKDNAAEMHLYDMFNIDVLGTSQELQITDVTSWRTEDMEQIIFQYFMQYIS